MLLSGIPFQERLLGTGTALHETGSNWVFDFTDWNGDGTWDLAGINLNGTGTDTTEIHVLDGADGFQSFLVQTGTALGETTNSGWNFDIEDWNADGVKDLVGILKAGATGTEVHVLNGADDFQSFLLQTSTALGATDSSWDFDIGDWNRDGARDLVGIKKSGTGSGHTEVHILSGAGGFHSFLTQVGTGLHETGSNFAFDFEEDNRDGIRDLVAIKQSATGTNSTEIHIYTGATTPLSGGDTVSLPPGSTFSDDLIIPVGQVALDIPDGTVTIDGTWSGSGEITKEGNGTLVVEGDLTYSGPTTVVAGTLAIATTGYIAGPVIMEDGTILMGNGTVGGSITQYCNGHPCGEVTPDDVVDFVAQSVTTTFSPSVAGTGVSMLGAGASPGILTTGGLSLHGMGAIRAELYGSSPGSGYDQIRINRTVDIGGSVLGPVLGFDPSPGQSFVIVDNDGTDPVVGTFALLPEGGGAHDREQALPYHLPRRDRQRHRPDPKSRPCRCAGFGLPERGHGAHRIGGTERPRWRRCHGATGRIRPGQRGGVRPERQRDVQLYPPGQLVGHRLLPVPGDG